MLETLKRWLGVRPPAAARSVPFSGAQIGRLTASLPGFSQSINADLDGSLVILRARARNLCANHEYGRRFLSMVATNVVGAYGPTLQVRAYNLPNAQGEASLDKAANAAIEAHWRKWSRRADITGRMTLPALLRVAMKSVARDGEVLIRRVRRRDLPYGIALQMLEVDRLDESINKTLTNGNIIRQGVEINSNLQPVAYYVRVNHPGDAYSQPKNETERVLAADIFHLFVPERAEQIRGYTWMHAVLMRAQMLQGYEEAALVAARVGAAKMGVFTAKDDGGADPLKDVAEEQSNGALHMSAEAGEFIDLRGHPGTTLEAWNPEYPRGEFGSFVQQCLRGIASGLDVDYATLANDLSSVNYSSIRAGTIETREMWILLQEWLIDSLLLPLYREWLAAALPLGAISFDSGKRLPAERLEKFSDAGQFVGRRWPWVDPLKDAQASRELIAAGLASRTEIAASQGRDFVDIVDELAAEEAALKAAGLASTTAAAPAAKPAPAPAPEAEDDAEDEDEAETMDRKLISELVQFARTAVERAAPIINVPEQPAPIVNVEAPVVHVAAPVVTVEPAQLTLEATLPAAQVHMAHPARAIVTHERDAAGELIRSITTYEAAPTRGDEHALARRDEEEESAQIPVTSESKEH